MCAKHQEGPHSTLPEDEFFDAVESGLDKIEEDRQLRVRLKLQSQQVRVFFCFLYHLYCLHIQTHKLKLCWSFLYLMRVSTTDCFFFFLD